MTTRKYTAKNIELTVSVASVPRWGVKDGNGQYVNEPYTTFDKALAISEKHQGSTVIPVMGLERGLDADEFGLIARGVHDRIENELANIAMMFYGLNGVRHAFDVVDIVIPHETLPLIEGTHYVTVKVESATVEVTY